jgi:exodeoxyribonuclease V beta subunit
MREFDVAGPLPTGVTVLEASAGTGKTFTIAALAARFVAEDDVPLEQLLLITFTRMATSELRDRVRNRFLELERGLTAVLEGDDWDRGDKVLAHLARDDVENRRNRLANALAHFDGATIATTHQFCGSVLGSLGVAGDVDRDATFVEDPRALVDEVVADLYVGRYFRTDGSEKFPFATARALAAEALRNSDAALQPANAKEGSTDWLRYHLVKKARDEVDRRRRLGGVLTYDDLLTRLDKTLRDDDRGAAAVQRLRDRYRVVLVDEFQDTDPIQWEILSRAFAEDPTGGSTLVLIGDPKQAIYAFRGADVHAYLAAAEAAGDRATLATNWRSDQLVLDGLDALFGNARLGHTGIEYRRVKACDDHTDRPLVGAPDGAGLRIRLLPRTDGNKPLAVGKAREAIGADVAADIALLLRSGATFAGKDVKAGDVAVLVHRHVDARIVHQALGALHVPAVINGAGSVFRTEAALDWRKLLEALERPSARTPAAAVALTPFVGKDADWLAAVDEDGWEELHSLLHRWSTVLRKRGVAALLETISFQQGMPGQVLAYDGGERDLTDIRHVGQLLHAAAASEQLGTTALSNWLRLRIEEAENDIEAEERTRRLESDADAVQVLTIYRAKGLEYPFVYCPFVWDPAWIHKTSPPVYHPDGGHGRTIYVGQLDENSDDDHSTMSVNEKRGEELRLLYVALTRAMAQVVLWWAPTRDSHNGPLTRLVFGRKDDGEIPSTKSPAAVRYDEDVLARFTEIAESASPGCISVDVVDGLDAAAAVPFAGGSSGGADGDLAAAVFDRDLDPRWRRTSYTGITAGLAHEARVASEAEEPVVTDEVLPEVGRVPDVAAPNDVIADLEVPSLLATMRSGAEVGTFLHGVLEEADFTVDDLAAELSRAWDEQSLRGAVDVGARDEVLAGLASVVETPLGPLVDGLRLRDISRRDRIDELWFELPLVGGDSPSGSFLVNAIGSVLRQYCDDGDPLLAYADRLDDPTLRGELRGYLAGSLDLVLRTPDRRFAVADYKSNWLGVDGEELSCRHYRPEALNDAMYRAHYPLQALLYTVALHRYLRWRVAGYSPEQHLAGVLYLFVRGMVGESTPLVDGVPCGVWSWQPPAGLVEALSDLFDRGSEVAA